MPTVSPESTVGPPALGRFHTPSADGFIFNSQVPPSAGFGPTTPLPSSGLNVSTWATTQTHESCHATVHVGSRVCVLRMATEAPS